MVDALRSDSGPPLFYALEGPFARTDRAASRDFLLRLIPFAAALALFAAARTLPPGAARSWWIALCAGDALVNLYAAEARAYALLALAILAVFLLATRGGESPPRLAGLFLAAAAALWLHYLALLAVAAALALALSERRLRSALAIAAAFAAFAPWGPILARQPAEAMAWLREPPARALPGFLSALGGVGRIPSPFGAQPPLAGAAAALVGILLVALLVPAAREDRAVRSALVFVLLVVALALAASLWRPIAFAGRSEMAVLPVWLWAVARAAPGRRAIGLAAGAAAVLGSIATVLVAFGPHPRSTPAAAVGSVARLARAGDTLAAGPGFLLPALVAADRGLLPARVVAFPESDAPHPGWFIAVAPGIAEEASLRRCMAGIAPGSRLYVLLPPSHDTPGVLRVLSERGTVREMVRQPDAVLLVWTPNAAVRDSNPAPAS